jgi:hypothetical protein
MAARWCTRQARQNCGDAADRSEARRVVDGLFSTGGLELRLRRLDLRRVGRNPFGLPFALL